MGKILSFTSDLLGKTLENKRFYNFQVAGNVKVQPITNNQ